MKNRFVISESDRRSILSMYGLLNEENTTRIVGQVRTIPDLDSNTGFSRAQNLTLNLYGDDKNNKIETLGGDGIIGKNLISTTVTNNNGEFIFQDVTDLTNLTISFEGNEFFEPTEHYLQPLTPNKDNKISFSIKYKKQKVQDTPSYQKKEIKKCEKKESDKKRIYGYGEYIIDGTTNFLNMQPYDEQKMYEECSKIALKDAIEDYLELFPNEKLSVDIMYNHILSIKGTNKLPKLKIICKKISIGEGKIVTSMVVKFKKSLLDELTIEVIPKEKTRKIEFDPYDFQTALQYSYDLKRKIFLFFCDETTECTRLLNNFVSLGNLDKKLNGWIKLYYYVDRSETKKYIPASETLKVDTYPTVVLLESIKDPRKNTIKDSIKIIKKITSFDETDEGLSNLLT